MLPDYYYKIYQVSINENGVFYRTRDNDGNLSNFNKTNYDKIERELIPLSKFLFNAKYYGLPANINCINLNQQQELINSIILYRDGLYTLVYDIEPINSSIKYLPLKVIPNDNLISFGVKYEKTDIYNDPKDFYHDLFIEILETTKDKNSGKQK